MVIAVPPRYHRHDTTATAATTAAAACGRAVVASAAARHPTPMSSVCAPAIYVSDEDGEVDRVNSNVIIVELCGAKGVGPSLMGQHAVQKWISTCRTGHHACMQQCSFGGKARGEARGEAEKSKPREKMSRNYMCAARRERGRVASPGAVLAVRLRVERPVGSGVAAWAGCCGPPGV